MTKARVRLSAIQARDEREFISEHVVISSFWKLGRGPQTAIAFVQIAQSGNVLEIFDERAVVLSPRTTVSAPPPETITRAETPRWASQVRRVGRPIRAINGESVCSVPQQMHRPLRGEAPQLPEHPRGQAVVMVHTWALGVSPVHVNPQSDRVGGAQHFKLPSAARVAVPERPGWVERYSVDRHSELPEVQGSRCGGDPRAKWHLELMVLCPNSDGIVRVGEIARSVRWKTIGYDDSQITGDLLVYKWLFAM